MFMLKFFSDDCIRKKKSTMSIVSPQHESKNESQSVGSFTQSTSSGPKKQAFFNAHLHTLMMTSLSNDLKKNDHASENVEKIHYRPEAVAHSPRMVSLIRRKKICYTGWILIPQENGRYLIKDTVSNNIFSPTPGTWYIFVRMLDGSLRIAPRDNHGHAQISQFAEFVLYAGGIWFDAQQKITQWDNDSQTYRPSASLNHQAGFSTLDGQFRDAFSDSPRSSETSSLSDIDPSSPSESDSSSERNSPYL